MTLTEVIAEVITAPQTEGRLPGSPPVDVAEVDAPLTLNAASLLQLMWLASPALPVGGFSYSEGLESAVDSGRVSTESHAKDWLLDQLHLSLARSELAVMAQAHAAWTQQMLSRIEALNQWVLTTRESSELRQQTMQMGRSLGEWLKNQSASVDTDDRAGVLVKHLCALHPAPTWPIALALATARAGVPVREALLTMAFGWAENMVQAALKAVPLGQNAGQRVLAALCSAIPAAVENALHMADEDRQAHSPMLAILSAQHELQYSRLFRS